MPIFKPSLWSLTAIVLIAISTAGCGQGNSSNSDAPSSPATTATIASYKATASVGSLASSDSGDFIRAQNTFAINEFFNPLSQTNSATEDSERLAPNPSSIVIDQAYYSDNNIDVSPSATDHKNRLFIPLSLLGALPSMTLMADEESRAEIQAAYPEFSHISDLPQQLNSFKTSLGISSRQTLSELNNSSKALNYAEATWGSQELAFYVNFLDNIWAYLAPHLYPAVFFDSHSYTATDQALSELHQPLPENYLSYDLDSASLWLHAYNFSLTTSFPSSMTITYDYDYFMDKDEHITKIDLVKLQGEHQHYAASNYDARTFTLADSDYQLTAIYPFTGMYQYVYDNLISTIESIDSHSSLSTASFILPFFDYTIDSLIKERLTSQGVVSIFAKNNPPIDHVLPEARLYLHDLAAGASLRLDTSGLQLSTAGATLYKGSSNDSIIVMPDTTPPSSGVIISPPPVCADIALRPLIFIIRHQETKAILAIAAAEDFANSNDPGISGPCL